VSACNLRTALFTMLGLRMCSEKILTTFKTLSSAVSQQCVMLRFRRHELP
jgi:hypothetical protein